MKRVQEDRDDATSKRCKTTGSSSSSSSSSNRYGYDASNFAGLCMPPIVPILYAEDDDVRATRSLDVEGVSGRMPVGATVFLQGLGKMPELNGCFATICSSDDDKIIVSPGVVSGDSVLERLAVKSRRWALKREKVAFVPTGLDDGPQRLRFEKRYAEPGQGLRLTETLRIGSDYYRPAQRDGLSRFVECARGGSAEWTALVEAYLTVADRQRLGATCYSRAVFLDCARLEHQRRFHTFCTDIITRARDQAATTVVHAEEPAEEDQGDDEQPAVVFPLVRPQSIAVDTASLDAATGDYVAKLKFLAERLTVMADGSPLNVRFVVDAIDALAGRRPSSSKDEEAEQPYKTRHLERVIIPMLIEEANIIGVVAKVITAYVGFGVVVAHALVFLYDILRPRPYFALDVTKLDTGGFHRAIVDILDFHGTKKGDLVLCEFALKTLRRTYVAPMHRIVQDREPVDLDRARTVIHNFCQSKTSGGRRHAFLALQQFKHLPEVLQHLAEIETILQLPPTPPGAVVQFNHQ